MLTNPQLRLVSIVATGGWDETELLMLAGSLAHGLEPSLGRAIRDSARERNLEPAAPDAFEPSMASAVRGSFGGRRVAIGDADAFADFQLPVHNLGEWPERLRRQGQRILFVAVNDQTVGFLGLSEIGATRGRAVLGSLVALLMSVVLAGCATEARSAPDLPRPTVPVVRAEHRDIPLEMTYTGRVDAVHSVELRPRVGGALDEVLFREGSLVQRGMPLFRIDQRPFAIALRRAEADVATMEAQLARAREESQRADRLVAADAMSVEERERRRAEVLTLEGRLDAARAAAQDAALHLEFTTVRAPVSGRVGRAEVTIGNLVSGGPNGGTRLAVLHSIDPTYVYFELDPATAATAAAHKRSEWKASVSLFDGGDAVSGPIDFIDNGVGPETGTLKVRARLPNPSGRLLPGSVVKVAFRYGIATRATVVPEIAIGTEQGTRYVLVAGEDGTVQYRPVSLGAKAGAWRVVSDAVKPGDAIVLPGMPGLRPGMKVTPVQEVLR